MPAKNAEAGRAACRRWYHSNVERSRTLSRQRGMKARYGITVERYDAMLAAQGGHCAICPTTEPGGNGRWHIDHDHLFGARDPKGHRGLLCHHCNLMLGNAKDDETTLRNAVTYLRKSRG